MPALISNFVAENVEKIEKTLQLLVPEISEPHALLYQAARYSLLSGGKRIRPILLLAVVETFQGSLQDALVPACALELIHTYSMIHDDLPCMDDDDFRRGKPTLHKQYSEGIATLAGDFLLTKAFELLAYAQHLKPEQKLELIQALAVRSGGNGMIAGQLLDLEAEKKQISLDELKNIHAKKTGDLIVAALEMGAICAHANPNDKLILTEFGQLIGFAFQIVDDVLDATESKTKHGKEISSDQIKGKNTYVSILGIEKSNQTAEYMLEKALLLIQKLPFDTFLLKELAKMLVCRKV